MIKVFDVLFVTWWLVIGGVCGIYGWVYFARMLPRLDQESMSATGSSIPYPLWYTEQFGQFLEYRKLLDQAGERPWFYSLVVVGSRP